MCWGVVRRTPLAAAVTRDLPRRDEDHSIELRDLKRVAEGWGTRQAHQHHYGLGYWKGTGAWGSDYATLEPFI